ncbi:MAG TPA: TetR/AcrR family transcriptional regulator [Candidatus Baltobacteraceae bacterium]|nr:TetR/AcrR family transcriptional regulator [Candidatus Baltobacteraceae bacterium]
MEARRPYDIDSVTDVAFRIFAERGFDAASMEDVARAAGITKASIYHHVPSKEALLARGLDRALTALFAVLEERDAREGAPRSRLAAIVRRAAEITMSMRAEVSVLFRVRGNSKTEREAMERRRAFDACVAELVREAQAAGEVRADIEPAMIVRLIFGMSNSLVEWYRPGGRTPAAAIAAAVERIVFEGIDG